MVRYLIVLLYVLLAVGCKQEGYPLLGINRGSLEIEVTYPDGSHQPVRFMYSTLFTCWGLTKDATEVYTCNSPVEISSGKGLNYVVGLTEGSPRIVSDSVADLENIEYEQRVGIYLTDLQQGLKSITLVKNAVVIQKHTSFGLYP